MYTWRSKLNSALVCGGLALVCAGCGEETDLSVSKASTTNNNAAALRNICKVHNTSLYGTLFGDEISAIADYPAITSDELSTYPKDTYFFAASVSHGNSALRTTAEQAIAAKYSSAAYLGAYNSVFEAISFQKANKFATDSSEPITMASKQLDSSEQFVYLKLVKKDGSSIAKIANIESMKSVVYAGEKYLLISADVGRIIVVKLPGTIDSLVAALQNNLESAIVNAVTLTVTADITFGITGHPSTSVTDAAIISSMRAFTLIPGGSSTALMGSAGVGVTADLKVVDAYALQTTGLTDERITSSAGLNGDNTERYLGPVMTFAFPAKDLFELKDGGKILAKYWGRLPIELIVAQMGGDGDWMARLLGFAGGKINKLKVYPESQQTALTAMGKDMRGILDKMSSSTIPSIAGLSSFFQAMVKGDIPTAVTQMESAKKAAASIPSADLVKFLADINYTTSSSLNFMLTTEVAFSKDYSNMVMITPNAKFYGDWSLRYLPGNPDSAASESEGSQYLNFFASKQNHILVRPFTDSEAKDVRQPEFALFSATESKTYFSGGKMRLNADWLGGKAMVKWVDKYGRLISNQVGTSESDPNKTEGLHFATPLYVHRCDETKSALIEMGDEE